MFGDRSIDVASTMVNNMLTFMQGLNLKVLRRISGVKEAEELVSWYGRK